MSKTHTEAKVFLGKKVKIVFDRPLGSKHPKFGFVYEVNYGFVPNTKALDGEEIDVYYLGKEIPLKRANGFCIAIIHREDDNDDKLVVVPSQDINFPDDEILHI